MPVSERRTVHRRPLEDPQDGGDTWSGVTTDPGRVWSGEGRPGLGAVGVESPRRGRRACYRKDKPQLRRRETSRVAHCTRALVAPPPRVCGQGRTTDRGPPARRGGSTRVSGTWSAGRGRWSSADGARYRRADPRDRRSPDMAAAVVAVSGGGRCPIHRSPPRPPPLLPAFRRRRPVRKGAFGLAPGGCGTRDGAAAYPGPNRCPTRAR